MNEPLAIAREVLGVGKPSSKLCCGQTFGVFSDGKCVTCGERERGPLQGKPPLVIDEQDIIRNLRAERDALAERLRQSPDMRGIVGELRGIYQALPDNADVSGRALAELLGRLEGKP